MAKHQTLAVVGLGYVGLPLALLAERKGYKVIGVVRDEKKAEKLNQRIAPFKDADIEKYLADSQLEVTTDYSRIQEADIVVICVPTPVHEDYSPDLGPVKSASTGIGSNLKRGQLIILESTVNPGVSEDTVLPILEIKSGLVAGKDFYLAHCPERINPGDPKWHVENINRVVGSLESVGLEKAVAFYESILTGKVKPMGSLKEAEAVKVVENSFRDINIAFVNELALSFAQLGIDVVKVIDGAATKPFAFLAHYPGCGVGGHCIPVDPYYLIEYAKTKGFYHDFLMLARRINNNMPRETADLVLRALNEKGQTLNGAKVAVCGVAYKSNIDDYRESPAFEVIHYLQDYGADLRIFDPYVEKFSNVTSLDEALTGAHAVVITTAHNEFKKLQPADLKKYGVQVVIDGRNCLDKDKFKQAGLTYYGIGR